MGNDKYKKAASLYRKKFPYAQDGKEIMLPEVTVSALTDKSYNKLTDAQKQVYDSFIGPDGGVSQTVDIGNDYRMHWGNALKMVDDLKVKNIFNRPNMFMGYGSKGAVNFRPHANPLYNNIYIPKLAEEGDPHYIEGVTDLMDKVRLGEAAWVKEMSEEERADYLKRLTHARDSVNRKMYFSDLIAELAHIPEFWRSESFTNLPITIARRIKRGIKEGSIPDYSNYRDPKDIEYHTHTGPNSFEQKLREKYGYEYDHHPNYQDGYELSVEEQEIADKYQPVVDWYAQYMGGNTFDHLKNKIINNSGYGLTPRFFEEGENQSNQYTNDYPYIMQHADEESWDELDEPIRIGPAIQEKYTGTRGSHAHRSGNHTTTRSRISIDPRTQENYHYYTDDQQLGIMAHELGHTDGGFFVGDPLLKNEINKRNKAFQKIWGELSESEKQDMIENPHKVSYWLKDGYHTKEGFHNANPKEVRSDVIRFRYQADKDNIYNSTGDYKKFTEEDLEKMREAYPQNRLFKNFSDEDIIWLMDNVADASEEIGGDDIPQVMNAKYGTELPAYKKGGPGLWANIHAKRKRGESPANPGDKDYPDSKQWNKLTNLEHGGSLDPFYTKKRYTTSASKYRRGGENKELPKYQDKGEALNESYEEYYNMMDMDGKNPISFNEYERLSKMYKPEEVIEFYENEQGVSSRPYSAWESSSLKKQYPIEQVMGWTIPQQKKYYNTIYKDSETASIMMEEDTKTYNATQHGNSLDNIDAELSIEQQELMGTPDNFEESGVWSNANRMAFDQEFNSGKRMIGTSDGTIYKPSYLFGDDAKNGKVFYADKDGNPVGTTYTDGTPYTENLMSRPGYNADQNLSVIDDGSKLKEKADLADDVVHKYVPLTAGSIMFGPKLIQQGLKYGSTNLTKYAGTSIFDGLGYWGAYEGATHLPEDVKDFVDDPSWAGAGNIGLDLLGVAGGIFSGVNAFSNFRHVDKVDDIANIGKATDDFVSDINWSKWNKDIPVSQIDEYKYIEQVTKQRGTYMKNADGSDFAGSPEQFIQMKSKNFNLSYPEGYKSVHRGVPGEDIEQFGDLGQKPYLGSGLFTANKRVANNYSWRGGSPRRDGHILNLAMRNSDNSLEIKGLGNWFADLNTIGKSKEILKKNIDELKKLVTKDEVPDYNSASSNAARLESYEDFYNNYDDIVSNPVYKRLEKFKNELLQSRVGTKPPGANNFSTDDLAVFLEQEGLSNIRLNFVDDGMMGNVNINNQIPGNYLKSLEGNVGTFDLNNPNIYKKYGGGKK